MTETYRQISIDHTTHQTLKRQRIRAEGVTTASSARARSADDGFRKSGRGPANFHNHNTTSEREKLDESWRPAVHPLLQKQTTTSSRLPLLTPPQSPAREHSISETPFRRHSDSSESPLDHRSPPSTTNSLKHNQRTPLVLKPRNFNSLSISKARATSFTEQRDPSETNTSGSQAESSTKETDLDNKLERLFLDGKDSADIPPKLVLSTNKKAQIAERQRLRDLQKAEERRQEEKRLADEVKRLEQEQLEREAQARLRRRLPNKPLIGPLDQKWEQQVDNSYLPNNTAKIVTTSIGGTELAVKDFKTLLNRHSWLNDEIINSYIEWVVDAANKELPPNAPVGKEKPVPKFIAHNSFFYENLTKKGPTSTDRLMKRKGAGGNALLQVDTIFVPICRGSHWTIGTVRPFAKTIEYFDSFGGQGAPFIASMRTWLKHQLGDAYIASEWKEPRTGCASQSNGWDCGVFVCTNAFCVAFGLETSCYRERDMESQRRRIAALLINRGFRGEFAWESMGL